MKPRSSTRSTDGPPASSRPHAEVLDRLYAAPFEDFVPLRKELAVEVRATGDLALSREVLAAKKPSRTAWAINHLARKSPDALRAAFEAFDAAARAQSSANADAIRETARAFREHVNDAVTRCERLVAETGDALNPTQARRLTETIRAAIAGGPESRERLLSRRLTADLNAEESFAGVEAPAGSGQRERKREKDRDEKRQRQRELEARKAQEARKSAIEQARQHIAELEAEVRDARETARTAEVAASRAEAEAARARSDLAAVEERLARARGTLRDL